MKKATRVKKATGREMKRRAMNLMSLAYDVSTMTKHDVFCNYSPHVDWCGIRVHKGGWKSGADSVDYTVKLDNYSGASYDSYDEVCEALSELMKGAKK